MFSIHYYQHYYAIYREHLEKDKKIMICYGFYLNMNDCKKELSRLEAMERDGLF